MSVNSSLRLAKAMSRVNSAWTVPGLNPSHHFRMQEKLEAEWPTLANALKELSDAILVTQAERLRRISNEAQ